ncbi:MAG: hypothetical protein Q9196_002120 [Gyalolechia fulgens]
MYLETFIKKVSIKDPRDEGTVIATSLLIDFLYNVVPRHWDGFLQAYVDNPKMQEPSTGPLWKILKSNGWCPSEAKAIVERFSVSGSYYMTQIRPPNPLSHLQGEKCLHYKCDLRQLNDATYQTKHASGCSGSCAFVGANPDVLASILVDKNTIPLIRTLSTPWFDEWKTPEIVLEPWNGSKPFVALSHVWADGLGNPNANALPRCQMQRLTNMVQSLSGQSDILFWLDTICVPPDTALANMNPSISKKQRQAQDQAIVKMRQTYVESSHVLVLDTWVMLNAVSAMSDVEKLMRIFCSGWNTRLWTYQEGALAKRLSFILWDEIYDLDEAVLRIRDAPDWSLIDTLRGPLLVQYDILRGFQSQDPDKSHRIKYLISALACRATSVATDETLCLSALMGFNVQEILDVKDPDPKMPVKLAEARMIKFWSMFDRVPPAIINFTVSTLSTDGYGWAPSSLLLSEDSPIQEKRSFITWKKGPASRTDRGLNISLAGLVFRSNIPLGLEFYVEDDQGQLYHFYFRLSRFKDRAQRYTHNHSGHYQEEICIDVEKATGRKSLAFIFDPDYQSEEAQKKSVRTTFPGIIAAISQDQADGVLEARKLGFAVQTTLLTPQHNDAQVIREYLQKSSQNLQDYQNHSLEYPAKGNGTLLCAKGTKVQSQTWCIV